MTVIAQDSLNVTTRTFLNLDPSFMPHCIGKQLRKAAPSSGHCQKYAAAIRQKNDATGLHAFAFQSSATGRKAHLAIARRGRVISNRPSETPSQIPPDSPQGKILTSARKASRSQRSADDDARNRVSRVGHHASPSICGPKLHTATYCTSYTCA